jgi:PAS domain S-box-containing protein
MTMNVSAEGTGLHAYLNDLVRVLALPALRAGSEPPQIVGTLLDALLEMLRLEFTFVRLNDPDSGSPLEVVRGEAPFAEHADLSLASARLGLYGELGILVAGSGRPNFPEQTERVLLDVAASQAALALQQTRLLTNRMRESRVIVDSIPGLVALLSPTGEVETVNRQLLDYFRQSLEELRQWGTNGTVHPEDLPHVVEVFTHSIATGSPYEIVQRLRRADGVYRWMQNSGFPLRDTNGRVVRWCVLLTDIDERKRAEDALNSARSELAHVARVSSLGVLTASIAHEINQPLSGIVTNASTCLRMLADDPPNVDGARETARRTIRDGNRASDVIARLRALFSRKEPSTDSVDLNEATREVIALASTDLQRNRVVLQSEFAGDLPPVIGDRVQLQQVILNLVRNASDAMVDVSDRPRLLRISTAREDGDCVRVSVRDAGVGIDPQSLDKLFDAFYTTKSSGMGIGLSVSRSIVERHHGRLWAEPNEGPGATFSFSIPRSPENAADAGRQ